MSPAVAADHDLEVIEKGAVDRTRRLLEQALAVIELKAKQA